MTPSFRYARLFYTRACVRVKLLAPAVACLLLAAGCGGSGEEQPASKLGGKLRNEGLGYSLRFPDGWKGGGEQKNAASVLRGDGRECVVVPVVGLPDWSDEEARRRYYEELARRRKLRLRSTDAVKGENAEGITTVSESGSGRPVRSSTFASGGVGLTLSCSAPKASFEKADEEVFLPMASTVRLRRNADAERLQPRLIDLEGVTAAGIVISGSRAQAQLRLSSRDAGLPAVKETLQLLVSELDAQRIGVQAFEKPANPVIGNWDARTKRAFVQAIPGQPERFALPDN